MQQKLQQIEKSQTLKETVKSLPKEFVQILGLCKLPSYNGQRIIEAMMEGKSIGSCDGSLHDTEEFLLGDHSFSI